MKRQVFIEVIHLIKKQNKKIQDAYNVGVDLIEFYDSNAQAISHLIGAHYGKEGLDIFNWWCYERNFGKRTDLTMTDGDGNILCLTIDDLYEYLEENKNSSYDL